MKCKTLAAQHLVWTILLLLAVACSAPQATIVPTTMPPGSTASRTSELLVKRYIDAYATKNAEAYFALFDADGMYVDYGMNVGPSRIMGMKDEISAGIASRYFEFKVTAFFVSADGSSAAVEGIYTDWIRGGNTTASVPCLAILEIKNDKIIKESLYYNGAAF